MDKAAAAIICVIITGFGCDAVSGSCSVSITNLQLNKSQGNIAYQKSIHDNCTWTLLDKLIDHHALLINFKYLSMTYGYSDNTYCSGSLSIGGGERFCTWPRPKCRIYASPKLSCDLKMFHDQKVEPFFGCEWIAVEILPRNITLASQKPYYKSMDIDYRFISCDTGVTSRTAEVEQSNETTTQDGGLSNTVTSCPNTATFIVIISLMAFMLLVACAAIVFQRGSILRMKSERLDTIVRHSTYVRRAGSLHPELLHDHGKEMEHFPDQPNSSTQATAFLPRIALSEGDQTFADGQALSLRAEAPSAADTEESLLSHEDEDSFLSDTDQDHVYSAVNKPKPVFHARKV